MQEFLYISYNVFEGSNALVVKPEQEKNRRLIEVIREKGGFDLWVKLDEDQYSENQDFMHIETGLVVKFPKWRDDLAWVRWGAKRKSNLVNWINVAGIELSLTQYFTQCIRMCGKKLILTTQGQNDTQIEKLNEMLNSFNNFLHFNLKNQSDLEPLAAFTGEDLHAIKDSVYYYLDRLKFEFGRVANTNPKGERITSGENYKDITAIANRQKINLENLNDFSNQVMKKFGVTLEFAVSGIPEKEAVYSIAHGAQTPNMVKEMFGQIEGTNPRPPKGEAGLRRNMKSSKVNSRDKVNKSQK